jgi:fatty-acyl-CoA synthase
VRSTMQDTPLLVSRILEQGRTVHGRSTVTTWTGDGEPRRRTFREIGGRAAQLANALRDELGVEPQSVLATLMWNSVAKTLCR